MTERLSTVLFDDDTTSTDRILAAAFFRKRPLQAGSCAEVVDLAIARERSARLAEAKAGPSNEHDARDNVTNKSGAGNASAIKKRTGYER